jgi:hypothetical protein
MGGKVFLCCLSVIFILLVNAFHKAEGGEEDLFSKINYPIWIRSPTLYPAELWAPPLTIHFFFEGGGGRGRKNINLIGCILTPLKLITHFYPFSNTG